MSNRSIFSGNSRLQSHQGRNANLASGMFKRTSIFNHPSTDKQEPMSPFANYAFKINQSLYLQSQTTTKQQTISNEAIRLIIKQQLSKLPSTQQNTRKMFHTSQAQISDLKDKISHYQNHQKQNDQKITTLSETLALYQKQNSQKLRTALQQAKEHILSESKKIVTSVQTQITDKFRIFFQKVNLELKKDIIKVVSSEFLSFDYGEDLQNRLSTYNDRLEAVQNIAQTKTLQNSDDKQKTISSQQSKNYELKLSSLQKQLQGRKKQVQNLSIRLGKLQQWKSESQQKKETQQTLKNLQSLNIKIQQISQQTTLLHQNNNLLQTQQQELQKKIKAIDQRINQLNQNKDKQQSLITDLLKKIEQKDTAQQQLQHFIIDKQSCTSSIILPNPAELISPTKVVPLFEHAPQQTSPQQTTAPKLIYQVDKDGHLMDGDGKYLLSEQDQMIWLSDEQIKTLLASQEVELIDC